LFGKRKPNAQLECRTEAGGLSYLLYLPSGYAATSEKEWPLILYLHGIGERGSELGLILKHGIPKIVENRDDFPFIAVSPQCPEDTFWHEHHDALKATLDDVVSKYAVDDRRIYLTGNSMGGYGTWGLAMANPNLFAAIAPICAGGKPEEVCILKDVPVWAFHGELDTLVELEQGQKMVDALVDCGGTVRFTVYEGVGHDSWTKTYENPELYSWFLKYGR
jgi:predicted peptidase